MRRSPRCGANGHVAALVLALSASAGGLDARLARVAQTSGRAPAPASALARRADSHRSLVLCSGGRGGATLAAIGSAERSRGGRVGKRTILSHTGWTSFYGVNRYAASTKDITPGSEAMQWYLRAIGRDKLLDREKEIILASRIRILLDWEGRRLQEEEMLGRKVTLDEWAEVIGKSRPARACAGGTGPIAPRASAAAASAAASSCIRAPSAARAPHTLARARARTPSALTRARSLGQLLDSAPD